MEMDETAMVRRLETDLIGAIAASCLKWQADHQEEKITPPALVRAALNTLSTLIEKTTHKKNQPHWFARCEHFLEVKRMQTTATCPPIHSNTSYGGKKPKGKKGK